MEREASAERDSAARRDSGHSRGKPAPHAGKMLLRRNVGRTRRGDPQPHGLSLASAAFFVIVTACSERFAAADGPSRFTEGRDDA
jgi:hypothetical protein